MSTCAFKPAEMFRVLALHDVRYVLIGGLAATLHGSPLTTGDVDICPSMDTSNQERLAVALREMRARIHSDRQPEGVDFIADAAFLERAEIWNFVTQFGRLDLSYRPSGTQGYEDLRRDAVGFELDDVEVQAASLADVIRSKEAAGRERDRQALPTLRRLLERLDDSDR